MDTKLKIDLGKGGISSIYTLLIALGITMLMAAEELSEAFYMGIILIILGIFLPIIRVALEKKFELPITSPQIDTAILGKLLTNNTEDDLKDLAKKILNIFGEKNDKNTEKSTIPDEGGGDSSEGNG